MAQIFAGTSGFSYPAWKPDFYPEKLPAKQFLAHYASRLNAVEINYTFRRNPTVSTLEGWVSQTPDGFVFAVKAHQRITHILKLKNAEEATSFFLKSIDPLRVTRRLGPVLVQLPPTMRADTAVLADYLAILPTDLRFAFEFRHTSWLEEPVYSLLRQHSVALCLAESDKLEVPHVLTADFVYWRLRKPEYSTEDRAVIAKAAQEWLDAGKDVYLFFKHEETPEGALHAEEIRKTLGGGKD